MIGATKNFVTIGQLCADLQVGIDAIRAAAERARVQCITWNHITVFDDEAVVQIKAELVRHEREALRCED